VKRDVKGTSLSGKKIIRDGALHALAATTLQEPTSNERSCALRMKAAPTAVSRDSHLDPEKPKIAPRKIPQKTKFGFSLTHIGGKAESGGALTSAA